MRDWAEIGKSFPHYENWCYKKTFRMDKPTFISLCEEFCIPFMPVRDTQLRPCIPAPKRLAMFLEWVAFGSPYEAIAGKYDVSRAVTFNILHEVAGVLKGRLTARMIRFPVGDDLMRCMEEFEHLCCLPFCAGAMDGTFMKIDKPFVWGDTFYCYKKFPAIIVFACTDASGCFRTVSAGRPGQVGDALTFNFSKLKDKIDKGEWLQVPQQYARRMVLNGVRFKPYLCADSAFALSTHVMKCYEVEEPNIMQLNFNYALIRTRRVVECTFGRWKMRFRIVQNSRLSNPRFAADVALVTCALHNFLEKRGQSIEPNPGEPLPSPFVPSNIAGALPRDDVGAVRLRDVLADHVTRRLQISPAVPMPSYSQVLNGPVEV